MIWLLTIIPFAALVFGIMYILDVILYWKRNGRVSGSFAVFAIELGASKISIPFRRKSLLTHSTHNYEINRKLTKLLRLEPLFDKEILSRTEIIFIDDLHRNNSKAAGSASTVYRASSFYQPRYRIFIDINLANRLSSEELASLIVHEYVHILINKRHGHFDVGHTSPLWDIVKEANDVN